MNMIMTVKRTAVSKKRGLMLGDLIMFCEECKRAGLPVDAEVRAMVGWVAQVRELSASGLVARAAFDYDDEPDDHDNGPVIEWRDPKTPTREDYLRGYGDGWDAKRLGHDQDGQR